MNNDKSIIPGITEYLPPTKFGYKDPIKTKAECKIKEEIINIIILSFFSKILYAKVIANIKIKNTAIKIVSKLVTLSLLKKNFGIELPKNGLIKILYEKLSIFPISKANLFALFNKFKNIKIFVAKGITEHKKFKKLSLFFSKRYFKKKIGANTLA